MHRYQVTLDGVDYTVELTPNPAGRGDYIARINGEAIDVHAPGDFAELDWVVVDGHSYEVLFDRDLTWMQTHLGRHHLAIHDLDATVTRPVSGDGRVKAPIPGLIARILIAPGQDVTLGQPLVLLEAMKMENEIRAPRAGVVRQINVHLGQIVVLDEVMIEIE